jgi:mRNA interferase MazF
VWLDFDPQSGHEQAGRRPGLVLSPAAFNKACGLCFVAPVTNTGRGLRTQVPIPAGEPVTGVVLADHTKSLDFHARRIKFVGVAAPEVVEEAMTIVLSILDAGE